MAACRFQPSQRHIVPVDRSAARSDSGCDVAAPGNDLAVFLLPRRVERRDHVGLALDASYLDVIDKG